MNFQACIDDLLIRGIDDWVDAAEVASVIWTTGCAKDDRACRELSLQLIRNLLEDGLAELGMVHEQNGFVPWLIPADAAIRRIENDWPIDKGPELGEVFWLNLTKIGLERAQSLWSNK